MKRIIAAALLAAMTVPALAASDGASIPGFVEGLPYSDLEVDRALPNVKDPVVDQPASGGASTSSGIPGFHEGLPYSGLEVDRALPNVKDPIVAERPQYAGPATDGFGSTEATGPWANDWNFIAPSE